MSERERKLEEALRAVRSSAYSNGGRWHYEVEIDRKLWDGVIPALLAPPAPEKAGEGHEFDSCGDNCTACHAPLSRSGFMTMGCGLPRSAHRDGKEK